jgi:hypothetical protein
MLLASLILLNGGRLTSFISMLHAQSLDTFSYCTFITVGWMDWRYNTQSCSYMQKDGRR